MPHQNRVTPFGELIATPERGTMYGNRGCLVDSSGAIKRRFKEIRWIICVLNFKNRRHPMMEPGRYTGLFFLDEAAALAAGHRPCAECQRKRFEQFRGDWAKGNPQHTNSPRPLAPVMDCGLAFRETRFKKGLRRNRRPSGRNVYYLQPPRLLSRSWRKIASLDGRWI